MSGEYLKSRLNNEFHYMYGFLTKYHGSLNNPSRANGDFREQIFARDNNRNRRSKRMFRDSDHAFRPIVRM